MFLLYFFFSEKQTNKQTKKKQKKTKKKTNGVKFHVISKTRLIKYIENFTTKKLKFSEKNSDIFHISAQNIDCGY